MQPLPYTIIKSEKQYYNYCDQLEELVFLKRKTKQQQDAIELLTLLIEKWDADHNTFSDADPVELLRSMMTEHSLKSVDLAGELDISKSLLSDILNYRRGLSKEIIRKLANRFKLSQEAFNKPYKLTPPSKTRSKEARIINTGKKLPKTG